MRRCITKLTLLFLILALALFGAGNMACKKAAQEVNFGIITALSGPAAPWGIANSRSMTMMAEKINEEGGFQVEGKTYKWKVFTYDSKYVPAEAVKALNKAIYNDKVSFVAIQGGSPLLACIPLLKENNMLSLNDAAGGKAVTNPDNPLVFRYNPSIEGAYVAELPFLQKREGIKTIASINPDDATGRSGVEAVEFAAKMFNLKIIAKEYFERGSKEFTPLLTRIIAKKPDLIETGYTDPTSSALLLKQARELGYKGVMLLIWGPDPKQVLKIAGPHAEGAYLGVSGPEEPQSDAEKELYKRFLDNYPKDEWNPNYYTHHGLIKALTMAIVKCQSFDPTTIAKTIEDLTWDAPQGVHSFGGSKLFGIKRQLLRPATLLQVKDGKAVWVATIPVSPGIFD
jgi:branched-chain amino acid transport system substrate-binding protein